jgi:uncharacterized membrane protein
MELAIVRFDGPSAAESAFGAMRRRAGDAPWTREVAFLEHHHNDRITLLGTVAGHYVSADETDHVSQAGAAVGGIVGALLGIPLGPPTIAAGFITGAAVGAELGAPEEVEAEPRPVMDHLRATVPKGFSGIVLIAEGSDVDDMVAALGEAGAGVVRRLLSDADVARIAEALRDTPPASSGPRPEGEAARRDPGV